MAEVSYYSYEYDPDSEPFLADADGGAHSELLEGGGGVEQKAPQPTDVQLLPIPDTKDAPQRWYDTFTDNKHSFYFFQFGKWEQRHRTLVSAFCDVT